MTPRRLLSALAVLAVAAGAAAAVLALKDGDGDGGTLTGAEPDTFKLSYPAGWSPFSTEQLQALAGSPLAVLAKSDKTGLLIVRREKRARRDLETFTKELDRAFKKRIPDFRRQTARKVAIGSVQGFLYSYIRTRTGAAYSVVLVPAGDHSYVMNAVVRSGAKQTAEQLGDMIASFRPPGE